MNKLKDKPETKSELKETPFPDIEIKAVGFAKVPNKKGMYLNYTIHIKNNQITKITYGDTDYKNIVQYQSRFDWVNNLLTDE